MKRIMRVSHWLVLSVLAYLFYAGTSYAATEPLFYAPFDEGVNAAKSVGSPVPINKTGVLVDGGIYGKALSVGVEDGKGYWTSYNADGNIRLEQGTISFWLKPVDWDGKDKNFKVFFTAWGDNAFIAIEKYIDIGVAKSAFSGRLLFVFGPSKQKDNAWQQTKASSTVIGEWQKNEWHHIAGTWDDKSVKLYVDGKLVDTRPLIAIPATTFKHLDIGGFTPEKWKDNIGRSLVDEFKIYDSALSAKEIYEDWEKKKPVVKSSVKSYFLSVPMVQKASVQDGVIDKGEYSLSSTGFLNISTATYAPVQSQYNIAYDQKNLYIGIASPFSEKAMAKVTGRDDVNVAKEDCIEIFLNPAPQSTDYFHFIFNSAGAVYDEKNRDSGWNAPGVRFNSRKANGVWTFEAAIPFLQLGVNPPVPGDVWTLNICRSFTAPKACYTCIAPSKSTYHNVSSFIRMKFADPYAPFVNLNSIGDLLAGNLGLNMTVTNLNNIAVPLESTVQLQAGGANIINYKREFLPQQSITIPVETKGFKDNGQLAINLKLKDKEPIYTTTLPFAAEKDSFRINYIYTRLKEKEACIGLHQPFVSYLNKDIICRISFSQDSGEKVALEKTFSKADFDYEVPINISSLAPGKYKVYVMFQDYNGSVLATLSDEYTKYPDTPPAWAGNKIGITDAVPYPWNPIETTKNSVKCWGREYVFDKGILPTQIKSAGKELLASPIRLTGSINGKKVQAVFSDFKWKRKAKNKVDILAEGKLDDVKVATDISVEYDGFMWINLSLDSTASVRLDNLALEIPFRKEYATLRNFGDYRLGRTGELPDEISRKNLEKDKPIFWIGGNSEGLQWFAEGMSGWHIKNLDSSLEVVPQQNIVIARLNIVDTGFDLNHSRKVSFGFQATPVKPEPAGWRNWRICYKTAMPWNTVIWFTEWTELFNYMDTARLNSTKIESLKRLQRAGKTVSPYAALTCVSPLSPEYKYYGGEWEKHPLPWNRILSDSSLDPQNRTWAHNMICMNSSSYRDFYIWKLNHTVTQLNLEGLYFDWAVPYMCNNEEHGCGYRDDSGVLHPTFSVLGARELAKRIYSILKQNVYSPKSVITHHMSGEVCMPVHAFADIMIDGENLTSAVAREESYYKCLPIDKFQAEYAHQWGSVPVLLAEFKRGTWLFNSHERAAFWDTDAAKTPINHLLGLVLVHDGICYSNWNDVNQDAIWRIQDDFGWDDKVEFLPYWNNSDHVTILSPKNRDVVVSIYKREGRYLLIPFNNTDEEIRLSIKINPSKIKLKNPKQGVLTDKISKEVFALSSNGNAEISMGRRSFRALEIN